jgi:hypothetical protein
VTHASWLRRLRVFRLTGFLFIRKNSVCDHRP